MKTLTITSDIFANEWAESFLKALMGNVIQPNGFDFIGFHAQSRHFIVLREQEVKGDVWCNPAQGDSITFNLDELSVDTKCLDKPTIFYYRGVWDLDYLAKQKGIEIK